MSGSWESCLKGSSSLGLAGSCGGWAGGRGDGARLAGGGTSSGGEVSSGGWLVCTTESRNCGWSSYGASGTGHFCGMSCTVAASRPPSSVVNSRTGGPTAVSSTRFLTSLGGSSTGLVGSSSYRCDARERLGCSSMSSRMRRGVVGTSSGVSFPSCSTLLSSSYL